MISFRKQLWISSVSLFGQLSSSSTLYYIFFFLTVSISSGLVYGWPALRRNLVTDHRSTLSEKQLGVIFTIGSWSTQGGCWFSGMARDKYSGTRTTTAICLLMTSMGCAGIAICDENDFVRLSISMFLVGTGSGAQLCLQPVAELFDAKYQGSILASLSGAFQVSGLMFLLLTTISHERKITFGSFVLLLCVLAVIAFCILPKSQFKDVKPKEKFTQE